MIRLPVACLCVLPLVGFGVVLGGEASNTRVTAVPTAISRSPSRPPTSTMPHGVYSSIKGAHWPGIASLGFGFGEAGAYDVYLNPPWTQGLQAMVWLGGYDNSPGVCAFRRSDEWVTTRIAEIGDHPGVFGYYIDDEPHANCPDVAAQISARSELVHSLDPGSLTVIAENKPEAFEPLANVTDVLAVATYPCNRTINGCNWTRIPQRAAQAEAAGWNHYWGVVQSFGDDYYKVPTPAELQRLLDQWHATRAEGLWAYTWDCCGDPDTLKNHPELWETWRNENGMSTGSG